MSEPEKIIERITQHLTVSYMMIEMMNLLEFEQELKSGKKQPKSSPEEQLNKMKKKMFSIIDGTVTLPEEQRLRILSVIEDHAIKGTNGLVKIMGQ